MFNVFAVICVFIKFISSWKCCTWSFVKVWLNFIFYKSLSFLFAGFMHIFSLHKKLIFLGDWYLSQSNSRFESINSHQFIVILNILEERRAQISDRANSIVLLDFTHKVPLAIWKTGDCSLKSKSHWKWQDWDPRWDHMAYD